MLVLASFGVFVALAISCGSSDEKPEKTTTTSSKSSLTTVAELSTVPTTFTGGDKQAFCAAFVEMESNKHLEGSTPDDIRAYYRRRADFLHRMRDAASDEIRSSIGNHLYFNAQVIKSGQLADLTDAGMQANTKIVYGYARAQCGSAASTTTAAG